MTISGETLEALKRIAEREDIPKQEALEESIRVFDIITAIQADGNALYRVNEDGDLIEVDLSVGYVGGVS